MKYINYNMPTRAISHYNHLARGPAALVLGDYKSHIAFVGCYNLYIYIIYIQLIYYVYSLYSSVIVYYTIDILYNDGFAII